MRCALRLNVNRPSPFDGSEEYYHTFTKGDNSALKHSLSLVTICADSRDRGAIIYAMNYDINCRRQQNNGIPSTLPTWSYTFTVYRQFQLTNTSDVLVYKFV